MAWVANALAYMAINTLIPAMPTLTRIAAAHYAAAGSVWGLARFAGFALFWAWAGWHYRARWMLIFHGLLAGSFFLLLFFPRIEVLLGMQVIFGLAAAFIYSSSLYYAMHVSAGAAGHAGIHEALIGAGTCVGPMVGALSGGTPEDLGPIALGVTGALVAGGVVLGILALRAGPIRRPTAVT